MSRYNPDLDAAQNLNAARCWADRCLQTEGSIFSDNESLWTPTLLDELDRLFVQNYDDSEGRFIQKLKGQLQAGSPASRKLMAEALWILIVDIDAFPVECLTRAQARDRSRGVGLVGNRPRRNTPNALR
jgi:hypothetical protein